MSTTITIDKAMMMEEIRKLVSEGKTVTITVKGNSMNPFVVHLRDQMTLGPWKKEDIRRGTVALVKDITGNYLIHRIMQVHPDKVILHGDGNVSLLETATWDNIIAIMYSVTRKGRTHKTDGLIWRTYSAIWMFLTPLRRWPLGLWRKLRAIFQNP